MVKKQSAAPSALTGVGNTKTPDSTDYDNNSSLWWCFTMNNYSQKDIDILCSADSIDSYVFQEEVAESGTKHLQGTCKFRCKKRMSTIKNWETNTKLTKCHWEKTRSNKQSILYCSDPSKRSGEVFIKKIRIPEAIRTFEVLRPWQQVVWNEYLNSLPEDRSINWYWERLGNLGKSAFARWCVIRHQAFYICGSAADMKCGLAALSEKHNGWFPKLIILDIPRDSQGCSYKGLEEIKNGIFYSTKYESGMCVFNSPYVIVFSNAKPNLEKMSRDRWNITNIGDDEDSDDTEEDAI